MHDHLRWNMQREQIFRKGTNPLVKVTMWSYTANLDISDTTRCHQFCKILYVWRVIHGVAGSLLLCLFHKAAFTVLVLFLRSSVNSQTPHAFTLFKLFIQMFPLSLLIFDDWLTCNSCLFILYFCNKMSISSTEKNPKHFSWSSLSHTFTTHQVYCCLCIVGMPSLNLLDEVFEDVPPTYDV